MSPEEFNKKHIYAYCAKHGGCTSVPLWTHIARKNASAARRFTMPGPADKVKKLFVKWKDLEPAELPETPAKKRELEETLKEEARVLNVLIEVSTAFQVHTFSFNAEDDHLHIEYDTTNGAGCINMPFREFTQAFQRIALQHLQASRKRYITYLIG